jgi:hypothetical protein
VLAILETRTRVIFALAISASLGTFLLRLAAADEVLVFAVSAIALAGLAAAVGEGTDQIG